MPDIIITSQFILQSSVADAATFAIAYPAGETQASMQARNFDTINLLSSGGRTYTGMTAAYGAGSITLTNGSGYTLPAGTYYVEFKNPVVAGDDNEGVPYPRWDANGRLLDTAAQPVDLKDSDGVKYPRFALDDDDNVTGLLGPDGRVVATLSIMIAQSAVPAGIPSSGSVGNNGALTGITALPITYSGIWLYFPAGALYSGSVAGFYWTVMNSQTAGTVYGARLSGTETPYIPANPPAISATGPGAYTQTTGAYLNVCTHTVQGGILGKNGVAMFIPISRNPSSANNKQVRIQSGLNTITLSTTTTNTSARHYVELINRGVENAQIKTGASAFGQAASDSFSNNLAIDTDVDWPVTHQLLIANDSEYIVLERIFISILPRD